ncbi:MAG: hypothetical protein WA706_14800, partial [Pseudolabrys sp.]
SRTGNLYNAFIAQRAFPNRIYMRRYTHLRARGVTASGAASHDVLFARGADDVARHILDFY